MNVWARNKRTNKNIAIVLLSIILLQSLGILKAIGFDLSLIGIGGLNVFSLLLVITSLWLIGGLWKKMIGT